MHLKSKDHKEKEEKEENLSDYPTSPESEFCDYETAREDMKISKCQIHINQKQFEKHPPQTH